MSAALDTVVDPSGATRAQLASSLDSATTGSARVPGAVAIVTDKTQNLFEGASGVRTLGEQAAMTLDTELAVFSTTKAVAAVAVLQLVEEGRLDLDGPAHQYLPALAHVQVFEGFAPDGSPRVRPPRRDITTRMLLLHTSGFGYENFSEVYARLVASDRLEATGEGTRRSLQAPLLFDPGDDWAYGIGMDWAGEVVSAITGQRLGEVMKQRIFDPLEMTSTAFVLSDDMRSRLASIHTRLDDGSLQPLDYVLPQETEVDMAGHGLYSTAADYAKFLRMWLNDGGGPNGRVLRSETVQLASQNGLGGLKVKPLRSFNPFMTRDVELFPGVSKSWALSFMVNDEQAPTGRPAGSLSWVGIANSYFWIDRVNDIAGFWSTQVLPLSDPISLAAALDFETRVYANLGHLKR